MSRQELRLRSVSVGPARYIAQMSPQRPPAPPESLASAYAATDFIVLALRPITLRVDEVVTGLDEWLHLQRAKSAVVVSARSPFSQPLAEAEEDRRHEELRELVEGSGLRSTSAVGRPDEAAGSRSGVFACSMLPRPRSQTGCVASSSMPSSLQRLGRGARFGGTRTLRCAESLMHPSSTLHLLKTRSHRRKQSPWQEPSTRSPRARSCVTC
jgi:hypothetical protein